MNFHIYTSHFKVASNEGNLGCYMSMGHLRLSKGHLYGSVTLWYIMMLAPMSGYDIQNGVDGPWKRAKSSARSPHSTCGSVQGIVWCSHKMAGHGFRWPWYKPYGSNHSDKHIKRDQSAPEENHCNIHHRFIIGCSCPSCASAMGNENQRLDDPGTLMKNLTEDGQSLILILP